MVQNIAHPFTPNDITIGDGDLLTTASNAEGIKKSRFSTNISLF